MNKKVLLCWSGGKDSALALHNLMSSQGVDVVALLTTINTEYDRVSMHGVRRELIELQAQLLGLKVNEIFISNPSSNEEYDSKMVDALKKYKSSGVNSVAFGDIFLEGIREYREKNLAKIGMQAIFPLWGKDTYQLANEFIRLEFKSVITCVDSQSLDGRFAGQFFDSQFLQLLPQSVDPCGEKGEFHSFVFDGPYFNKKVDFELGETVLRDNRFYYCDILLKDKAKRVLVKYDAKK